jgi:hypothetical protein
VLPNAILDESKLEALENEPLWRAVEPIPLEGSLAGLTECEKYILNMIHEAHEILKQNALFAPFRVISWIVPVLQQLESQLSRGGLATYPRQESTVGLPWLGTTLMRRYSPAAERQAFALLRLCSTGSLW